MRKLGLLLSSMFVLGAFMGLNAVSAFAEETEWNRDCASAYDQQRFEIMPVGPLSDHLITANPYEYEPSSYEGRGGFCGPWARRTPIGQDPLTYGGANTFITRVDITVPYGVQVRPTVGDVEVSDGDYMGNATIQSITWPFAYFLDPKRLDLEVQLRADSRRQAPLAEQLPGDGSQAETRKGCPLDQDLPNPDTQKVIVCTKVDLPSLLGSNWNWTTHDDAYTPEDPSDDTFTTTIGELFGPINNYYGSVVKINSFYQCERVGGSGTTCGGDGRPNVHFNGFADDAECSLGNGTYIAVATRRAGDPLETEPAFACMPWTE